jgi:alpha-D-ribose 1-methylphosphonate 5-triphosphate synthase subunit PhnH
MMESGFANPVLDSQRCFRAVLEAMARPGRIQRLEMALAPPPPLGVAAAAALLTLADADTPVWLDTSAPGDWLRFHAGCPLVAEPVQAQFALACGAMPSLTALQAGTEEEPHRSATLLVQVTMLEANSGGQGGWRLTGPGIEQEHRLHLAGLPADFLAQWRANRARFPRGVDMLLCCGAVLAALPRTVGIEEA